MCVSRNIGSRTLFPILGLSLALNIQISLCKTISYIFNNFIIMGEIVHLALFVDYLKPGLKFSQAKYKNKINHIMLK